MQSMECDVLTLLTRAVSTRPDALTSPQTFGAALRSMGSVTLGDGTVAAFGAQPQTGAVSLLLAAGDPRCACLIPTGTNVPVTS